MWDAVGLALVHNCSAGGIEETTRHLLHLLDDVGHLQEMALAAIERDLTTAVSGNIRWDPCLQRRDRLRSNLASADLDVLELVFLDPSLLGVGVTLVLEELIHLRRQSDGAPYNQFLAAGRVGPAH
jgi:hypothetical protein